ncbi:YUC7, putative [Medicago truncatula]|uniref:YUC7, putative n=1 Tax=Medicago truncatula TaxID=3880 RepID=A0A072VGC2_MEDTR|nr:YUC7, putative [Medicago truncatula]
MLNKGDFVDENLLHLRGSIEKWLAAKNLQKWKVKAMNKDSGEVEEYDGRFLVMASGETSEPFLPEIEG